MSKKVLLFILFCIISSLFFIWILLSWEVLALDEKQKKEALESILGRKIREEKSILQGTKVYEGKFFQLSYPAYADDKKSSDIVFRLDSGEPKFRFVAMVTKANDVAVLEELSAVRMRTQSKLYQKLPIIVDGNAGLLFIKESDGTERSSFFLVNGRSFSFSITGVDALELEETYGKMMDSVKF